MKANNEISAKSERISLRLDAATKRRIEQAAALSQRSISGFIISSVLESAEDVIHESETHHLADEDRHMFFQAILNPPEPSQKLREAFTAYKKLTGKPVGDD